MTNEITNSETLIPLQYHATPDEFLVEQIKELYQMLTDVIDNPTSIGTLTRAASLLDKLSTDKTK